MITKLAMRSIKFQKQMTFFYSQNGQIVRDSDKLSQS
jgi:hypothetical protein